MDSSEQVAYAYAESLRGFPEDEKFQRWMEIYAAELQRRAAEAGTQTGTVGVVKTWFTPGEVVMYAQSKGEKW